MDKTIQNLYDRWLDSPVIDDATKAELHAIAGDEAEIEDRFYRSLEFGTGGLRGVIGAGTNRMNIYTVTMVTQGLANYICEKGFADRGVVISYDSRNMSPEFAMATALCLCANGIPAYLFTSLRPTPELSYAVRYLKCISGINITASHNPAKYNGYKVYWEDGAQIVSPVDKEIIAKVNAIADLSEVKKMSKEDAIAKGLLHLIDKEVDDAYIAELHKLVMRQDLIDKASDLKIVYTPLHGTGLVPVTRVLSELGFKNVYVVPEQEKADGNFPTVKAPNPEAKEAFALGLALAKKVGAELVMATDPDGDRLGIYALDSESGEYKEFTGNMSGALLCEYVLSQLQEKGTLPENAAVTSTVVITSMIRNICKEYGVFCDDNNLIGFKYIAGKIRDYEQTGAHTYVFGLEESYGCLPGTYARDKDAVGTVMLLAEAAAYYKNKGMTLWDQMKVLFEKYGYYRENIETMTLEGKSGAEKIQAMIQSLRDNPLDEIGRYKVKTIRDYKLNTVWNTETGEQLAGDLPKSNMIYYELEDDTWFLVRPSGTEPKIKFYLGVKGTSVEDSIEKTKALGATIKAMFA
ncbi:phospho-sugar mutase [Eubacterium sp. MSJ-33]|uniref:phospho-sugar mutase n=1 Tax=Eubacterium sp. MSJ-33 TaxID=2841528 RepID=UPI001C757CF8|nr:phospho-sugar mutase [Eubacterium sp. MSJ-33]QWT52097.1 phospho-sugar mutase [Eubacterium sp. MSJ-33]